MLQMAREETASQDLWKPIPDHIWEWVDRYTRRRAWRTGQLFELNLAEIDDLHQELMCDVAKRWRRYKRQKSPVKAFVAMLVDHQLADFANNKLRRVRDVKQHPCESLNDPVRRGDGGVTEVCERGELISEDVHQSRTQHYSRNPIEQMALQEDIRRLVAKLPPDLRQMCEYVMKYSIPTAANRLKIPLSTFRLKLKRLRKHFADLQCYLDQPSE